MSRDAAQTAKERVVEHEITRLITLGEPWAAALGVLVCGTVAARRFPGPGYAAGIALLAAVLGWCAWHFTHDKSGRHRAHLAVSAALLGGWVALADLRGLTNPVLFACALMVGGTALSWNIHAHSRHQAMTDLMSQILTGAADSADLEGAQIRVLPKRKGSKVIQARAFGVPGKHTGQDFADRAARLASGAGLPPGAVTASQNSDHSGHADLRVSDPRVLDKPLPPPPPSHPHGSIADPVVPGCWQDGDPVEYLMTKHHLVIAGATNSAKSTGGGWNLLAELITRDDVDITAIDITKGLQFLGPFEQCFAPWQAADRSDHRVVTDPSYVRELFTSVQDDIRPRTDYFASRGLIEWDRGCGKRFRLIWMEEAPDILDVLGDAGTERWCKSLKTARTAGIMFVWSGQRIDFSQLPTIARAQLAGRMIFGLADDKDEDLCLSPRQDRAGCAPAQWGVRYPGKFYLDAPCISDERVPMAARTWYWGQDTKAITQFAKAWPWRPPEQTTVTEGAAAVKVPDSFKQIPPDDEGWGDDLDADLVAAEDGVPGLDPDGPDYPGTDMPPPDPDRVNWDFSGEQAEPEQMSPEDADRLLRQQIAEWKAQGRASFRAKDLLPVWEATGRGRTWIYRRLWALADEGIVAASDGGDWQIRAAA